MLAAEQEGYLGGSKPDRFDMSDRDFFTGGLGLLNQSWLAMLPGGGTQAATDSETFSQVIHNDDEA